VSDQILHHAFFSKHFPPHEIQKAFDIITGKRPKTDNKDRQNQIESIKIGPEGISIQREPKQ
jgi:hypothetical protein